MEYFKQIESLIKKHKKVLIDKTRKEIIKDIIDQKNAIISDCGALATWTPSHSTGRAPMDTFMVQRETVKKHIDWDSPNNIPLLPQSFDMIFEDAIKTLLKKDNLYISNRIVGADETYSLPVKTISYYPLSILFSYTMFREINNISKSIFKNNPFTLLVLPYDKLDKDRYKGKIRVLKNGESSDIAVVMDFETRIGIVYGSAYMGSVKKTVFTVMNYYLPIEKILPLHCSANENEKGELSLFLGLSGTGKTTLSADEKRKLLGDDEHGWNNKGIANFENGCYAKLIDLNPEKEPEIYNACFHKDNYLKHGVIIENAMVYPDGTFDLSDKRFTENSRGSYLLTALNNIKKTSKGGHPKTIIFLTADANGVIPPIAKLDKYQAMLWFLMGYTSKLAGTETGIKEPVSTFSRFFGQPFMPCLPHYYYELLGKKMEENKVDVYLLNTGWSGGAYGVGKRMDIKLTRKMLNAALDGKLKNVQYKENKLFHISIPLECPDVPSNILDPINTWADKKGYKEKAEKLAKEFSNHFDKFYGKKNIDPKIKNQCPGK